MTDKATARPWTLHDIDMDRATICGDGGERYVASVQIWQTPRICGEFDEPERKANAALIVRAVNSFDPMREALEAQDVADKHPLTCDDCEPHGSYVCDEMQALLRKAQDLREAALKLAKEQA